MSLSFVQHLTHSIHSVNSMTCLNPSGLRALGLIVFSELYNISYNLSSNFNSSILQANTNNELFIVLFRNLLNNPPRCVVSFELGCFYFSLRRGREFPLCYLLPTALTVSTSFHLYRYYSMFIALLLRVIFLLLPPLAPSSGAYYTISDDRVPQMVPNHSNFSISEVVRYRCGLPQTISWPDCFRDPIPSFPSFLDT